jgi:hypothetical protein
MKAELRAVQWPDRGPSLIEGTQEEQGDSRCDPPEHGRARTPVTECEIWSGDRGWRCRPESQEGPRGKARGVAGAIQGDVWKASSAGASYSTEHGQEVPESTQDPCPPQGSGLLLL